MWQSFASQVGGFLSQRPGNKCVCVHVGCRGVELGHADSPTSTRFLFPIVPRWWHRFLNPTCAGSSLEECPHRIRMPDVAPPQEGQPPRHSNSTRIMFHLEKARHEGPSSSLGTPERGRQCFPACLGDEFKKTPITNP